MSKLIPAGYWSDSASKATKALPWPVPSHDWNDIERELVIKHLRAGKTCAHWKGSSTCRLCGKSNGSTDKTDGTFIWPEGLVHYVRAHNVLPSDAFLLHVRLQALAR